MFLGLPLPDPRLQNLIPRRRRIHHVTYPGVPPGLDLTGVVFFVFVVNPARAQWQLFLRVLEVPIAVAVGADQGTGFGVACMGEEGEGGFSGWVVEEGGRWEEEVGDGNGGRVDEPMYCIWWAASRRPIRRRLRRVRMMVDILLVGFNRDPGREKVK